MRSRSVRHLFQSAALVAIALCALPALAQESRPYTDGNVLEVTSVLTKPGMFDEYMKYLAGSYRQEMEELKKIGVVIEFGIYGTTPRRPGDPDLYLVVTYKNMATLDTLNEKTEPIERKIFGSMKQAAQGMIDRESMRTILGSELIRELKLK